MAIGSSRFPRVGKEKFIKISFGTICRGVLGHPFLVVTLLYLIILHRYFPFLFSLLVYAAPVLICTTLLLGTLLFHGRKQDHRVGNHDERNNVTTSLNNGVVDNTTYSVGNDGVFSEERFGEIRNDVVEKEVTVSRGGFRCGDFDVQDSQRLEVHAANYDKKYDKIVDVSYNGILHDRSGPSFSFDRKKQSDDRCVDYESLFSERDGGEKSSLDAMVSEVIPTPQETHPLLGSEDPRHLQPSHDTGLMSEVQSLESSSSSEDSDSEEEEEKEKEENVVNDEISKAEDGDSPSPFAWTETDQRILQELRSSEMEKNEHLESLISRAEDDGSDEVADGDEDDEESIDGIDDDVDEEEEEEEEDGNLDTEKDGSNQVTLWTEEDEKNLRHLGCSELERNLRLENLLARRRAKRNFSMISERNLIDLDKFVLPFPVTPISTTRTNPFDNHDDSSHHHNVTPIPGSAPSVTVPRKNPFDSPSTSPKKTLNLGLGSGSGSGSSSSKPVPKPEFGNKNRKEGLFRRYESFSAGFNVTEDDSTDNTMEFDRRDFVFRRHETFNSRTAFPSFFSSNKPVFVAEHVWHPSLDRQLSHESHDTESAESSTSSDTETSTSPHQHNNEADRTSSHIETGSESSEAIHAQYDVQDEHRTEVNVVDHVYQEQEVLHDDHDATSSSSSSSSEHDVENSHNHTDEHLVGSIEQQEIFHDDARSSSSSSEHDVESSVNQSQIEHEQVEVEEVPGFSSNDPLDISEASQLSTDGDHHPVEPVYDTSPSGTEKNTAFGNAIQE